MTEPKGKDKLETPPYLQTKGTPVYDRQGNLIGRTGEEPVKQPTPMERIDAGFKENMQKLQEEIGRMLNESGNLAWEAKHKVRPKSNYLNFGTRVEANTRLREIKARLDENKQKVKKMAAGVSGPEYVNFKEDVLEALNEIDRVFKGEA